MDCKTKTVFLILLVWNICGQGHSDDEKKDSLQHSMQVLFKDYYSSSFLWQSLAHYFNKSELALPGFSGVFYEFSKVDRRLALRVLELTALHGIHFKNYKIDSSDIIKEAIKNYKTVTGVNATAEEKKYKMKKFPYCMETKFQYKEKRNLFSFIRKKDLSRTYFPRASSIMKLTQIIENCYMSINFEQWHDLHIKYVILKEFSTEQVYRQKYISDLMQKLKIENFLVEFFIDKSLRSTVLKY